MTQETRARRAEPKSSTPEAVAGENTVLLRGRVSTAPERRELPSGSVIVTFRVTVPRSATVMTKGSRQTVDWLDCVAWGAGPQRTVSSWSLDDEVEVAGALRRRFYRGGQGTSTRLEVEVLRAKRVSRRRAT
jgi:single-strand DNA-binding protein